jgi:2'-5' RNA ligase
VLVPETEAVVGRWRTAHTRDGAAGMPAHVTLLYPFAPAAKADVDGVRGVATEVEPFAFALRAVREWPGGVVYLEPDPAEPFVELTDRLVELFPDYPPYDGVHDDVVPHLTVVHTDDAAARADAAASVTRALPIECSASEIWLMDEVNGRWKRHAPFSLGR